MAFILKECRCIFDNKMKHEIISEAVKIFKNPLNPLADLGGAKDACIPFWPNISSFSCTFWEKIGQIIGWHPTSGKSWIRHWSTSNTKIQNYIIPYPVLTVIVKCYEFSLLFRCFINGISLFLDAF